MATNLEISGHLNEQQVIMLRLLKTPLPDKDFQQMRKLAVKLLSKKMDDIIEDWEEKKNINAEDYEALSKGHFRSNS